jgi:hypothetical protein
MSEPKRYRLDPESYLAEHPQGDFVDYQDYARLKAEVDRLTKQTDYERMYRETIALLKKHNL